MKKIVLINQSAGYLTIDIANALVSQYGTIVLIAGTVKPMERELNSIVKTQKIIKLNRTSTFKRLFTWGWGSIQIFFLLLFKYRHYEVFYTTNPPMAYLTPLLIDQNYSIVVYDIFPGTLKNLGIKENDLIYRWWTKWNRELFKKSNKIITLSEGMADQLGFYVEREKIRVVPNWSGSERFTPIKKEENPFIKKYNFENKFIVLYSGNLGYTHSVNAIIEVARLLEKDKNICFLIIGEGEKKEKLIQLSKQYHLNNCIFLTWQPQDVLPYSLASADLAVITLNDENATLSVPSKTYNHLSVGTPLLCIAPNNSELSLIVNKYHNGICFRSEKTGDIANYIADLSKDKYLQKELSDNSINASKYYTYTNAMNYL